MILKLTVNGSPHVLEVEPLTRLVDLIRVDLGLVATKIGCGEGECGSCNVLIDGAVTPSCLVPAIHVEGREVVTLEGLIESGDHGLRRLRDRFAQFDAAQCGACTPGILVTCIGAFGDSNRSLGEDEIRRVLAGNLCRCTGYESIVDAVISWANDGRNG